MRFQQRPATPLRLTAFVTGPLRLPLRPPSQLQFNFVSQFMPSPSFPSHHSRLLLRPRPHDTTAPTTPVITTRSQLSAPFPDPDPFAIPSPAFRTLSAAGDVRPELLGALLLSAGLYLGFSQRMRWADALRAFLAAQLTASLRFLPAAVCETVADLLHPFPFLALGVGLDAVLRYAAGGNAVWAVATGVSTALYAGVYELGRQAAANSALNEQEQAAYRAFVSFADKQLESKGMCHFFDVRDAVRKYALAAPQLRNLPDETIRRFVMSKYPQAKRSPNGYYRGLSLRTQQSNGNSDTSF